MSDDHLSVIARVRRAMPRNGDVMLICDELERRVKYERALVPSTTSMASNNSISFDRKAYQREYMRKRRAKGNVA